MDKNLLYLYSTLNILKPKIIYFNEFWLAKRKFYFSINESL